MGNDSSKDKTSPEDRAAWEAQEQAADGLFKIWSKKKYDAKVKKPDAYAKQAVYLNKNTKPPTRRKAGSDRKYKVLKNRDFGSLSNQEKSKMKFEDRALMCIQHPFVLNIHEAFQSRTGEHNIVTEYCERQDLKKLLAEAWGLSVTAPGNTLELQHQLEYDTILTWFTQLLLALEESHSMEIIHRNLDSENVYLRCTNASQEEAKQQCARIEDDKQTLRDTDLSAVMANFGNARAQAVSQATQQTQSLGPVYYMSPENYELHRENEEIKPGKKADVWALGVLLTEMVMMKRIETEGEKEIAFSDSLDPEIQQLAEVCVKEAGDKFERLRPIFDLILVNGRAKEHRPFASDLLQLEPIKSKVAELVSAPIFKTEMRALCTKKLQFGFARPQEFDAICALMKKKQNAQHPEDVLEEYLQEYIERVTLGGEHRVRDKYNEGDLNIGNQKTKDWMKKEE